MKALIKIVFYCLLTSSFSSFAEIPQLIERQIQIKGLKKSSLGIVISKIQPDNSNSIFYKLNADQPFIPASLAKIAVLSALYKIYPPHYTFQTHFLSSGSLKNGILKGNLVLKGGGDPGFTSESLWNLTNTLTRSGIKKVEGKLLIDDNPYTKKKSRLSSDRSYLSPISASSLNWNSVGFFYPSRPCKRENSSGFCGSRKHLHSSP